MNFRCTLFSQRKLNSFESMSLVRFKFTSRLDKNPRMITAAERGPLSPQHYAGQWDNLRSTLSMADTDVCKKQGVWRVTQRYYQAGKRVTSTSYLSACLRQQIQLRTYLLIALDRRRAVRVGPHRPSRRARLRKGRSSPLNMPDW
jgi:hypothetical protein